MLAIGHFQQTIHKYQLPCTNAFAVIALRGSKGRKVFKELEEYAMTMFKTNPQKLSRCYLHIDVLQRMKDIFKTYYPIPSIACNF